MKSIQQSHPKLATALGVQKMYIKREDEHPYGSHKGRAIPLMIKEYRKRDGIKDFVISSSGNAALAAAMTVQKHNTNNPNDGMTLRIFVGEHMNEAKLQRLKEYSSDAITIEQVARPKQHAFEITVSGKVKNLRQSTDDLALRGYYTLAKEISNIPDLQAVFIPTSSGTTAQGIGEAFRELEKRIQIHIVQTSACHPIAEIFDYAPPPDTNKSIASAIVDHVAHRKQAVEQVVKESKGSGWIVSDDEITSAVTLIKESTGIHVSSNSALSIAGLKKAISQGWTFTGPIVCIFTGA